MEVDVQLHQPFQPTVPPASEAITAIPTKGPKITKKSQKSIVLQI